MNIFERATYFLFGARKIARKSLMQDFDEDLEDRIVEAYNDGVKWTQIAHDFAVGHRRITNILNKHKVKRRYKTKAKA